MAFAMPCKTCKTCKTCEHWETRGETNDYKPNFACIFRSQWSHKTAYGRIFTESSWGPYCRKMEIFLCLKPWRFAKQKKESIKNGRLEKIPAWDLTSQKWIRGDRWSKDDGRKSLFCLTDGHLSFDERWVGYETQKIQTSTCTPRCYFENDAGSYALFTEIESSAFVLTATKVMVMVEYGGSFFGSTFVGKAIMKHGWENILIGNFSLYIAKKNYSYLCMWMT